ncbi:branched-chain amino acid ABC transporter permease [Halodesulfovibrio sp.]|jgi:branched-chain amino acid transport system permease protein|uniref:branched-chain amino acid ABC transporter permease n=1 Tax=Halodesulfovibrio sp. TaxID=1912772 RepID=UPI0025DE099C|nr:branched-chain amino acid ABC transporter permease [Halodesulfovibrio sp.]MCT4625987.1 branched-chain amino acid ABC transporter permease [Halodesulfovibrio sp.]
MIIRKQDMLCLAGVALFACAPLVLNAYWTDVLNNIGLYAILALSLNIILGQCGLFQMGHAAFFAVGAYTSAILNTMFDIPLLWTMPLAGILAGLFGLIVARPIIHLRGDYLLIVTIGIVEIIRIALINDVGGLTGGANGIFGIDRPMLFGLKIKRPYQFFYLIWGFCAATIFLFHRLENSRFGRALNYIKDDDVAAEGSGIDISRYKLIAFVIGAFWAGMVGTIFAGKMKIISPESFSFWESVLLFTIVILGGMGSIRGVLLGAFLIIGLPELFRDFASARMLVFGAAMIAMMIFRTQGLLPPLPRKYNVARFFSNAEGEQ